MNKKIGIIGLGNLGLSLGGVLLMKGYRLRFIDKNEYLKIKDLEAVFLTVPDKVLPEVVEAIYSLPSDYIENKIFIHCAGSLGVEFMEKLRQKGGWVGLFHPVQSFPYVIPQNFQNFYALFCGDKPVLNFLKELFSGLNINIIEVEEKEIDWVLYHLSCFISSGLIVELFKNTLYFLKKSGIKEKPVKILLPLLKTTIKNIEILGVHSASSGPHVRKDFETIKKHIEKLKEISPDFLSVYEKLLKLKKE